MTLQAIIFDVDGTLAETEEIHRKAFNQAFAEAGLGWHWNRDLYRELLKVTGGKERIARYAASIFSEFDPPAIAKLHANKTAHYTEAVASGRIELRSGIASLITQARQAGIPIAIATTTSRAAIDALILATGLGHFDAIAAGDEVPHKKPAPDIYLLALERLALPANGCIAIEDSANGLLSAREAGITTLVTPSFYSAGEDFSEAVIVLDKVPPLERLIAIHAG